MVEWVCALTFAYERAADPLPNSIFLLGTCKQRAHKICVFWVSGKRKKVFWTVAAEFLFSYVFCKVFISEWDRLGSKFGKERGI